VDLITPTIAIAVVVSIIKQLQAKVVFLRKQLPPNWGASRG